MSTSKSFSQLAGRRNLLPFWTRRYRNGRLNRQAQALAAYANYYCLDGIADDLNDITIERVSMVRNELQPYASRTGTKKNLAALRSAGWRLLVSAAGELRHEGMPYALDNGAWSAFQQGRRLDEKRFLRAVDKLGYGADWIVVPDIVAGGLRSLDYSLAWLNVLRGLPTPLLIAVQDGMKIDDVREHLSPTVGIFLGGTSEWKEGTAVSWGALARRRNCLLHVGRVNSARRIAICAAAGATSFDGTSATRYLKTLPLLDKAASQPDLFPASSIW